NCLLQSVQALNRRTRLRGAEVLVFLKPEQSFPHLEHARNERLIALGLPADPPLDPFEYGFDGGMQIAAKYIADRDWMHDNSARRVALGPVAGRRAGDERRAVEQRPQPV